VRFYKRLAVSTSMAIMSVINAMDTQGHSIESRIGQHKQYVVNNHDFVLEKDIFSNIFEKDIRRVFIYKKSERLAKAIHIITPAFAGSPSLRDRLDSIAVGLIGAAILPPGLAREAFSRELLTLSSVLSIARSGGLLSPMNASLISNEAHVLLGEVATYEEPRLFLDDSPTLAEIAKTVGKHAHSLQGNKSILQNPDTDNVGSKNKLLPVKDSARRDLILSVIKDKGTVFIKDISVVFRDVSEKTIQRELQKLVQEGLIAKKGSRRWTEYSFI
jgi:hypothetical protein